jgi:hypothetical protein
MQMNNQALWLKVTRSDGVNIVVNFEQVIAIFRHDDGPFTTLTTAAGNILIREDIVYIQSHLPI